MYLTIYTDGASRGNPGPAAYGFVVKDRGGVILHEEGGVLGKTTNNVAEYTAVLKSLKYLIKRYGAGKCNVEVRMDSLLVRQQLMGNFKIKNQALGVFATQIKALEPDFADITYTHVPRAQNFIADRLANIALDSEPS